ncbi:hypothetical protein [Nocardia gamkensis]|uniref:Lipocalin-like domain-containing protein n=1 Tax=Nocardia gamkensis TaxID=352869 RepID=A0A7X6R140_9NOCA|nr:hypothetical protein [Nocardia gamkensis]NKY24954.1 lipocalin-like domain-containing protein [Nocardia gamkensis]
MQIRSRVGGAVATLAATTLVLMMVPTDRTVAFAQPVDAQSIFGSYELVATATIGDDGITHPGPWATGTLVLTDNGHLYRMTGGIGSASAPDTIWTAGTYEISDGKLAERIERSNLQPLINTRVEHVVSIAGNDLTLTERNSWSTIRMTFARIAPHETTAPADWAGTYELRSAFFRVGESITLPGVYNDGAITYMPDGTMFVVLDQKGIATPPYPLSVWYTGTYDLNQVSKVVSHHVRHANLASRENADLRRAYRINGPVVTLVDDTSLPMPPGSLAPLYLDWKRVG